MKPINTQEFIAFAVIFTYERASGYLMYKKSFDSIFTDFSKTFYSKQGHSFSTGLNSFWVKHENTTPEIILRELDEEKKRAQKDLSNLTEQILSAIRKMPLDLNYKTIVDAVNKGHLKDNVFQYIKSPGAESEKLPGAKLAFKILTKNHYNDAHKFATILIDYNNKHQDRESNYLLLNIPEIQTYKKIRSKCIDVQQLSSKIGFYNDTIKRVETDEESYKPRFKKPGDAADYHLQKFPNDTPSEFANFAVENYIILDYEENHIPASEQREKLRSVLKIKKHRKKSNQYLG